LAPRLQDESNELCIAIREHYKPANAADSIPSTLLGARISFFDKIDNLVGLLGIGIKPTGSKDPFALRRTSLGIVKLLCESDGNILDSETLSWYIDTLITAYLDQGVPLDATTDKIVKEFLVERFKTFVIDGLEIDADVVNAVVNSFEDSLCLDYRVALDKAKRTSNIATLDGFDTVRTAYKRAVGIIGDVYVDPLQVSDPQFHDSHMVKANDTVQALCRGTDVNFGGIVEASTAILEACDNVLMNDPDQKVRLANMHLLSRFVRVVRNEIGDLIYVASLHS
jgi:glycyl-tRNA synthetase beta chain